MTEPDRDPMVGPTDDGTIIQAVYRDTGDEAAERPLPDQEGVAGQVAPGEAEDQPAAEPDGGEAGETLDPPDAADTPDE